RHLLCGHPLECMSGFRSRLNHWMPDTTEFDGVLKLPTDALTFEISLSQLPQQLAADFGYSSEKWASGPVNRIVQVSRWMSDELRQRSPYSFFGQGDHHHLYANLFAASPDHGSDFLRDCPPCIRRLRKGGVVVADLAHRASQVPAAL